MNLLTKNQSGSFVVSGYHRRMPVIYRVVELIIIYSILYFVTLIYPDSLWTVEYQVAAGLACIIYVLLGISTNLYNQFGHVPIPDELFKVFGIWVISIFVLLGISFSIQTTQVYSRFVFFIWFTLTPVLLFLWRLLIRIDFFMKHKPGQTTRVVIAGGYQVVKQINETFEASKGHHMQVVGYFNDQEDENANVPYLGKIKDMLVEAKNNSFDLVYLNLPLSRKDVIQDLSMELADTTVSVYYIINESEYLNLLQPQWHHIGGLCAISIFETPFRGAQMVIKRIEDIILSSLILLIIFFPMILIGIAIKLTSVGPIFYSQLRYGRDGQKFSMLKFRTMNVAKDDTFIQAKKNDQRITKIGGFLRKTSLDEFPQFINVLKGEMSVVGPRPHAVAHNEEFRLKIQGYMLRHKVKPGITGLAQINGFRGETDTPEKMEKRVQYDLNYIQSWSVWLDIKIVIISVFKGFLGPNTY